MNTINYKKSNGMTLIELMVAISMLGVLITVGVPSFQNFIRSNTVENIQYKLENSLNAARAEAASRNTIVSVCASSDEATCGNDWSDGWIVFEDSGNGGGNDSDGILNGTEEIIYNITNENDYTVSMAASDLGVVDSITFDRKGFNIDRELVFGVICEPGNNERYAKGLTIQASGRITRSKDSSKDGVHEIRLDDGKGGATVTDLSC